MIPAEANEFLCALGEGLTEDERIILCGFFGNPADAEPSWWKPLPWHPKQREPRMNAGWNGYVTVGAFGKADDGTFRRRTATWTGGLALMVDDVGTKVDPDVVAALEPSAKILTSPGNEQWWYFFTDPERELGRFDAMIRAFIESKLLGKDPGMAGVARVGRLPAFQNLKPEYGGFTTKTTLLTNRRYDFEEVRDAFGLELSGRLERRQRLVPEDATERMAAFTEHYKFLRLMGQFKREAPDRSGWTEMHCPWVHEHTRGIDNGAGMREPAEENGWAGAFVCHHGSHQARTLAHLTDWIAEQAVEQLQRINDRAIGWKDLKK